MEYNEYVLSQNHSDNFIIDILPNNLSNKINYKINYPNINYCTLTIIKNKKSLWNKMINLLSIDNDNKQDHIMINLDSDLDLDSILVNLELEFESKVSIITESSISIPYINFEYYPHGCFRGMPKIITILQQEPLYLYYIEPKFNKIYYKYILLTLIKLFGPYNKLKKRCLDSSYYNSTHFDINTNEIIFGICKINNLYDDKIKFIIAYNKKILNKDDITIILKNIFIKN